MLFLRSLLVSFIVLALPIATQPTSQAVQTTPEQLRDSIKAITAKSLTLQDPVQRVAVIDGPLFSISQGAFSEIIAIYRDLAETARAASLQLRNLPRFESSPDVATMVKEIYDYYHSFFVQQGQILGTLTAKAPVFKVFRSVRQEIVDALLVFQLFIQELSPLLYEKIPDTEDVLRRQLETDEKDLNTRFESAMRAYT